MDGLKAYKYYMAIKLHFSSDTFNVFVNRGRINCPRDTFNGRNDRFIFEKLAKKFDTDKELIQFYAANFMYNHENVIYAVEQGDDYYFEYLRRKQSMTKIFSDDCDKISRIHHENNLPVTKNKGIMELFLGGKITLETISIIEDLEPFLFEYKQNTQFMLMFSKDLRLVEKSKGFVKYDTNKVKTVYNNLLEDIQEYYG